MSRPIHIWSTSDSVVGLPPRPPPFREDVGYATDRESPPPQLRLRTKNIDFGFPPVLKDVTDLPFEDVQSVPVPHIRIENETYAGKFRDAQSPITPPRSPRLEDDLASRGIYPADVKSWTRSNSAVASTSHSTFGSTNQPKRRIHMRCLFRL
jgi:hypothetical protein